MKKFFIFLICAAMSISASAGTKTINVNDLVSMNVIVRQDITFQDGVQVTVFYKKEGNHCEAWSRNLRGKDVDDLLTAQKTTCERVSAIPSDCHRVCRVSVAQIVRFMKRFLNAL